jgi:hypothetical protein
VGKRPGSIGVWARRIGVVAAAGLVGLPARAFAQLDAQHVVVHLGPCTRVDPDEFHRLFDIELNPLIDASGERSSTRTTTTVRIQCVPDGVQLYLEDSATGRTMLRVVDLVHVVDSARARLLVLLVTEFVVASWLELRLLRPHSADSAGTAAPRVVEQSAAQRAEEPRPPLTAADTEQRVSPQSAGAQPSAPVAAAAESTDEALAEPTAAAVSDEFTGASNAADGGQNRHWRLGVGFDISRISSVPNLLLGGKVTGAYRPWRALELCLGVQLSGASFEGSLNGQQTPPIALTMITASLAALFVQPLHDFELDAGGGLRGGFALLQVVAGNTLTPRQAGAQPWFAPIAAFGAAYRLLAELRLRIDLELGVMARGVEVAVIENPGTPGARRQSVAALRGWFGAATTGLDWTF